MNQDMETYRTKAQRILSRLDDSPGDTSAEQIRLVQDLDSVERKLQTMRGLYTQAYERATLLDQQIQQLRRN